LLEATIIRKGNSTTGQNSGLKALLGFKNMLIWPRALSSGTISVIPQLAGVTIDKDYFLHTITVTVTERQPFAAWCTNPTGNESCFWFDPQGVIFGKTFDTQGNAITIIHDYAQSNLMLNGKILPDEFIPNLISIVNVLKESGLNIQEIALHDLSLQQIDVTTTDGPSLYFSLRFPADNDLAVIKDLLGKPGFNKLQYIDFTVQRTPRSHSIRPGIIRPSGQISVRPIKSKYT
jgi:hypothetical protein